MEVREDSKFGKVVGGSRWFDGVPSIEHQTMRPVQMRWRCPHENCGGEMIFNGFTWPTATPGYHHTCNKCQFTAALQGVEYPRIEYLPC